MRTGHKHKHKHTQKAVVKLFLLLLQGPEREMSMTLRSCCSLISRSTLRFDSYMHGGSLEKECVSNTNCVFSGIHLFVLCGSDRGDEGQPGCCECALSLHSAAVLASVKQKSRFQHFLWFSGYHEVSGVLRSSTAVEGVPSYVLLGTDVVLYIQETL